MNVLLLLYPNNIKDIVEVHACTSYPIVPLFLGGYWIPPDHIHFSLAGNVTHVQLMCSAGKLHRRRHPVP